MARHQKDNKPDDKKPGKPKDNSINVHDLRSKNLDITPEKVAKNELDKLSKKIETDTKAALANAFINVGTGAVPEHKSLSIVMTELGARLANGPDLKIGLSAYNKDREESTCHIIDLLTGQIVGARLNRALNEVRTIVDQANEVQGKKLDVDHVVDYFSKRIEGIPATGETPEKVGLIKATISKFVRDKIQEEINAPAKRLFEIDLSAPDWSKKLDVDGVLKFASKARNNLATGQKDNRDIPHEVRPNRYLSVSRLVDGAVTMVKAASTFCAVASCVCSAAAAVGVGASLAAGAAPVLASVGFTLFMGYVTKEVLAVFAYAFFDLKQLPGQFDWSHAQAANQKAFPTDAEIVSALALTFNTIRGTNPDSSLDLPRNKYLIDLVTAMNELTGPNSKGATEGLNKARVRDELLGKIQASAENYERTRPKKPTLGWAMFGSNVASMAIFGV